MNKDKRLLKLQLKWQLESIKFKIKNGKCNERTREEEVETKPILFKGARNENIKQAS